MFVLWSVKRCLLFLFEVCIHCHGALTFCFHCRCFPLEIGIVQIALANFAGLLVKMLLKRMIQLILHYLLAVSVKKNVVIFWLFCFERFLFASVYFPLSHFLLYTWFDYTDHNSCVQDIDVNSVDSSIIDSSFCGQKCKEVHLIGFLGFCCVYPFFSPSQNLKIISSIYKWILTRCIYSCVY